MASSIPSHLLRPTSCFLIAPQLQNPSGPGTSPSRFPGMQSSCFTYNRTALRATRHGVCQTCELPSHSRLNMVLTSILQGLSYKDQGWAQGSSSKVAPALGKGIWNISPGSDIVRQCPAPSHAQELAESQQGHVGFLPSSSPAT